MRRLAGLSLAVLALALAGCQSAAWVGAGSASSMRAGTFAKVGKPVAEALAADGVAVVSELYAPASTRVVFEQGEESNVGQEIEQRLRERGYSVDVGGQSAVDDAAYVRFVLDEGGGLTRLTMVLWDAQSQNYTVLNRAYVVRRNGVVPAGSWTRKG